MEGYDGGGGGGEGFDILRWYSVENLGGNDAEAMGKVLLISEEKEEERWVVLIYMAAFGGVVLARFHAWLAQL